MERVKIDGILLLDKEPSVTTYDLLRKVKPFISKDCKVGHAGTLDPFATGLVIVLLGKATKLTDRIHKLSKTYEATAQFGYETDTQDPTGEIVSQLEIGEPLSAQQIEECARGMVGKYMQQPPAFSAKKVNGVRAYKLARAGKEVKITPKEIEIYRFELLQLSWPSANFLISVSSGSYIRTVIVDLARKLGSMATCTELRRSNIGPFELSESVSSLHFSPADLEKIIPIDEVYKRLQDSGV